MKKIIALSLVYFFAISVGIANDACSSKAETPALWANVPQALKNARWVWPSKKDLRSGSFHDIVNTYAKFRQKFNLNAIPKKAPFYISADQCYRLYINGKFVASGPARGYQHSQPFDEIDIAKYLKKGENLIAVRAYNAGRSTFGYLNQGIAGVIFALELGEDKFIISSSKTKMQQQLGCERDTMPLSIQMNNQEHIDLRIEDPAWISDLNFDDKDWNLTDTRVYNSMPNHTFESRMIPMLEEFVIYPKTFVAQGSGKTISQEYRYRNVADLFINEKVQSKYINDNSKFATATQSPNGEFKNLMFDFGKMVVGYPILKIDNAKGGEIVDVYYTECEKDGSGLNTVHSNLKPAHRLICRAGSQEHQFFQLSGLRYLTIRVRNNPQSDLKITPSLMWSAYPLGDKGKFKTSNKLINDIWQACKQTQKICSLDAYVDTPYREQAQWWGDARVQAWNTFFISGDARLFRRGIRSIAMQPTPFGLTYGHAPTMAHSCILPDFSLIWILSIWDYYWQTGEIEAYFNHRDTVKSIFKYFDSVIDPQTDLASYDQRFWLFLDWTKIQRGGQPTILNMWWLEALEKMHRLCKENGINQDAEVYKARADRLRKAITKTLLLPNGLLADGAKNGKALPETSIHAQVMAKMTNIQGHDFEKAKREILLPYLKGEKQFTAMPSSYWVVYVLQCMVDAGHSKEVYDFIKREWQPFAEYGTTFETFMKGSSIQGTHSHAWSAHPAFLLPQILGGIKQEAPAWKKVSIKPNFFEDSVDVSYPTPNGNIKVSYKKSNDGKFKTEVITPKKIEVVK